MCSMELPGGKRVELVHIIININEPLKPGLVIES